MKRLIAFIFAGCLAFVPFHARAAIAQIGGGTLGSGSSVTTSLTIVTTADIPPGSLVDIGFISRSGSAAISSVNDTVSNTYNITTAGTYISGRYGHAWSFTANDIPLGTTITLTMTASSAASAGLNAFSGVSSSPLDVNYNLSSQTGASISLGPTATLAQANEVAIAVMGVAAVATFTETSGFTSANTFSASGIGHIAFNIVAVTTAITYTATQSVSQGYGGAILTFKAAAGGASGAPSLTTLGVGL